MPSHSSCLQPPRPSPPAPLPLRWERGSELDRGLAVRHVEVRPAGDPVQAGHLLVERVEPEPVGPLNVRVPEVADRIHHSGPRELCNRWVERHAGGALAENVIAAVFSQGAQVDLCRGVGLGDDDAEAVVAHEHAAKLNLAGRDAYAVLLDQYGANDIQAGVGGAASIDASPILADQGF